MHVTAPPETQETPEERAERARLINARIAAGQAEMNAGQYVELDDLEDWFTRLEADPNALLPAPKNAVKTS